MHETRREYSASSRSKLGESTNHALLSTKLAWRPYTDDRRITQQI